jgi:hypothetical protein
MSLVFQNIDPPPPSPPGPAFGAGGGTLAGWRGGSIIWITRDTALYSTYVSTLWFGVWRWRGGEVFFSYRPPPHTSL